MIFESRYWKEPLIESAAVLEDFIQRAELTEEDAAKIEKEIFIGFYSIRKLMDTTKITDATKNLTLVLVWHPNVKKVFEYNSHLIDELYDLSATNQETRSLRFVCNQIIHSFVFMIVEKEQGGLKGVLFSSDKNKDNKLYFMDTRQVVDVFRFVGNDDPIEYIRIRDHDTGEFKTKVL